MKKKRLLFVNGHLNTGGVEKALLDVLTHLDYSKYEVDLLLTEGLGDYASQLPPQVNVLLRSLEGTYGSLPKVLLRCLRHSDWFSLKMRLIFLLMRCFGSKAIRLAGGLLTAGKEYDCAIGFRPGICTRIAAHAVDAKRRIAWWHHGAVNVEPAEYLEEVRGIYRIVAVSEGCRKMLVDAMPSLEDRLITIHNMLDVDAVRHKAEDFDPYGESKGFQIVSVGRLAPEKHFENAIHAAHRLKKLGVVFQWHLVGDGALREELLKKAEEAGVTDCFVFEGNQVNPYPYMKYADLFVHPSYVESFGIVVAETLALGAACVVTRNSGVMDFLIEGENAYIAEQSPESLAEAVVKVLKDRELYEALKKNSYCPEQILPDVVMKKIEELIEE